MKFVPPTRSSGTEPVIRTKSPLASPKLEIKNLSNSIKDFLSIEASKSREIG